MMYAFKKRLLILGVMLAMLAALIGVTALLIGLGWLLIHGLMRLRLEWLILAVSLGGGLLWLFATLWSDAGKWVDRKFDGPSR